MLVFVCERVGGEVEHGSESLRDFESKIMPHTLQHCFHPKPSLPTDSPLKLVVGNMFFPLTEFPNTNDPPLPSFLLKEIELSPSLLVSNVYYCYCYIFLLIVTFFLEMIVDFISLRRSFCSSRARIYSKIICFVLEAWSWRSLVVS